MRLPLRYQLGTLIGCQPAPSAVTPTQPSTPERLIDGLAARADQLAQRPLIEVPSHRPWQGWAGRRLVVTVALLPITTAFFHSAAGGPAWSDLGWTTAVFALALMGALVWASHIPVSPRTARSATSGSSPCAKVAGFHVITAGVLLSLNPTLPMVLPALAVQAMALHQRTTGACATS